MSKPVKYYVDFQYLPKGGNGRPIDNGPILEIEGPENQLPNVGDHVEMHVPEEHNRFAGKVRSRLFRYMRMENHEETHCSVNIVVEESDDDWGKLIKE